MTFMTITNIKSWRFGLAVLITSLLVCAGNTEASEAQLWQGESAGYKTQADPINDDVAFLIHLGRVQAAIGKANYHDKEVGMSNPFTPQILADYAVIDPIVSGKSSANLSLQPLLSNVAAPETFTIIMDQTPSTRMQRNAIHTELKTLIQRVDAIVTERFPSTRVSALAMSALLREAGELLRTGLSANGEILDTAKYQNGLQLMEAALRLRVNKVTACDRSREAVKQLKGNGPVGDLLDRLIIGSKTGKVNGNAGDAAKKLQQLGSNLPEKDENICQ